jgi:hypothetical protein
VCEESFASVRHIAEDSVGIAKEAIIDMRETHRGVTVTGILAAYIR